MMNVKELAAEIKRESTWNPELLGMLCDAAGMWKEWQATNGENFEPVIFKAAEKLGVEIVWFIEKREYTDMTRAEAFRNIMAARIQANEGEIRRLARSIETNAKSDPIVFADSIASDADKLVQIKAELSEQKDVLNMLNAILDEE